MYGDPISFVRVVDINRVEIHYEPHNDTSERYSIVERQRGRWVAGGAGLRYVE
jgi:hypothetical protein